MRVFHTYISILFYLTLLCSCEDNSEQHILNYQKNVKQVTAWIDSIRYFNSLNGLKYDNMNERFKIVHISDIHLSEWTTDNTYTHPSNLQEAIQFTNIPELRINALVATGDFIHNNEHTDYNTACTYMRAFVQCISSYDNQVPTFLCTGNHDTNMLTEHKEYYLNKQDLHNLLFAHPNYPLQQPQGENYFYADVKDSSGDIFRFISIDYTDQDDFTYSTLHEACLTQKQINWLIQTALQENITDKHHIIILIHQPLQPFSSKRETYMCAGDHLYGPYLIPDIINAFIKRTAIQHNYTSHIVPWKTLCVHADFTKATGNFVCYLGGHAHTSSHFEVLCNDIAAAKQVMLLANTMAPDLQNNIYSHFDRKANSINSNSFSIYAIDTQEHKIYITYFGAKSANSPTIESISYR